MSKTFIYHIFIVFILHSCNIKNKESPIKAKTNRIDLTKDIALNIEEENGYKIFFTTLNGKKHGTLYRYDIYNRIDNKGIYFLDTLLQSKEYHWNNNKLDSTCFYTYDYKNKDTIAKVFYVNYPEDSLFFKLRYKPFFIKDPGYKLELIGNGIITTIPNSDTIFSENYFSHFDRMKSASKYLYIQYDTEYVNKKKYYVQAFGLTLDNGTNKYLKRQIKIYFVPLFVKDSALLNRFKIKEITF